MNNNISWGNALTVGSQDDKAKIHINKTGRGWSMQELSPKAFQKTQANKFSYSGMTVFRRDGSK